MRKNYFLIVFFVSIGSHAVAQITTLSIPDSLKINANAVVRLNQSIIRIESVKSMLISTKRIVTILNSKGESSIDANQFYDNSTQVKSLEAVIYDKFGKEIKRYKKKDFKDSSVADGFSVLTDNRILYLDYVATEYPFTVEVTSEVETSNTAFVKPWQPIANFFLSVMKDELTIYYPSELKLKYKASSLESFAVKKEEIKGKIFFSLENVLALKMEEYAPAIRTMTPRVMFGLEKFNLEGKEGVADNWNNFGSWMNTNLMNDTQQLPIETQDKIKKLVASETDPIAKARKIYQYVQDKTRYVSVQVGIGGWKPMKAQDVDRLGYGDCKALSNYTRALLNIMDIPSYYTIIYGGDEKMSIQDDMVSLQGNHAILTIPHNDKNYFLECTSQTTPFGYQSDFTDDRFALLVKPEGGVVIKTNDVSDNDNSQTTKGNYSIDSDGNFKGKANIQSQGIQYSRKYNLERNSKEEQLNHYNTYFGNINNLKIKKIAFVNDKEAIRFSEEIDIEAMQYGSISGGRLIFAINAYNNNSAIPQRYRNRKHPFEIDRGFKDYDELTIHLPKGFTVESKPENVILKTKFGEYKTEYILQDKETVLYKRYLLINRGFYDKNQYEDFRKFLETIAKQDNSKIALLKDKN